MEQIRRPCLAMAKAGRCLGAPLVWRFAGRALLQLPMASKGFAASSTGPSLVAGTFKTHQGLAAPRAPPSFLACHTLPIGFRNCWHPHPPLQLSPPQSAALAFKNRGSAAPGHQAHSSSQKPGGKATGQAIVVQARHQHSQRPLGIKTCSSEP